MFALILNIVTLLDLKAFMKVLSFNIKTLITVPAMEVVFIAPILAYSTSFTMKSAFFESKIIVNGTRLAVIKWEVKLAIWTCLASFLNSTTVSALNYVNIFWRSEMVEIRILHIIIPKLIVALQTAVKCINATLIRKRTE